MCLRMWFCDLFAPWCIRFWCQHIVIVFCRLSTIVSSFSVVCRSQRRVFISRSVMWCVPLFTITIGSIDSVFVISFFQFFCTFHSHFQSKWTAFTFTLWFKHLFSVVLLLSFCHANFSSFFPQTLLEWHHKINANIWQTTKIQ